MVPALISPHPFVPLSFLSLGVFLLFFFSDLPSYFGRHIVFDFLVCNDIYQAEWTHDDVIITAYALANDDDS